MVVIDDAIISGFIGEAVSRCVDFSWTKIKEAEKTRLRIIDFRIIKTRYIKPQKGCSLVTRVVKAII